MNTRYGTRSSAFRLRAKRILTTTKYTTNANDGTSRTNIHSQLLTNNLPPLRRTPEDKCTYYLAARLHPWDDA